MASTLDLRAPAIKIKFDKGKTFAPIFYYLAVDNSVIDMTGWSARMQARATIDATSVLPGWDLSTPASGLAIVQGTATLEDGTTIPNAWGVKLNVPPAITAAISWTSAVFDIEVIDPNGVVFPFLKGALYPDNEATR